MRTLLRTVPRAPFPLARPVLQPSLASRSFTCARPLRIKEDRDRSPEEVEKQKQEALKNPEWNKEVASASEEVVGADQEKVKDHDKHMEKLQKQTAQKSEEKHPEGKS